MSSRLLCKKAEKNPSHRTDIPVFCRDVFSLPDGADLIFKQEKTGKHG
jgi:hypothetical protein